MNAFEKTIKEQLIAYKEQINEAKAAGNKEMVCLIRAQVSGYLKGLETCLNHNYVTTFVDYVNACY